MPKTFNTKRKEERLIDIYVYLEFGIVILIQQWVKEVKEFKQQII